MTVLWSKITQSVAQNVAAVDDELQCFSLILIMENNQPYMNTHFICKQ